MTRRGNRSAVPRILAEIFRPIGQLAGAWLWAIEAMPALRVAVGLASFAVLLVGGVLAVAGVAAWAGGWALADVVGVVVVAIVFGLVAARVVRGRGQ